MALNLLAVGSKDLCRFRRRVGSDFSKQHLQSIRVKTKVVKNYLLSCTSIGEEGLQDAQWRCVLLLGESLASNREYDQQRVPVQVHPHRVVIERHAEPDLAFLFLTRDTLE